MSLLWERNVDPKMECRHRTNYCYMGGVQVWAAPKSMQGEWTLINPGCKYHENGPLLQKKGVPGVEDGICVTDEATVPRRLPRRLLPRVTPPQSALTHLLCFSASLHLCISTNHGPGVLRGQPLRRDSPREAAERRLREFR